MAVYLIHFVEKHEHARHYLGYARDVAARFARHLDGRGSRLLAHLNKLGLKYMLVRIWSDGDRDLERKLKGRKKSAQFCPICNPRAMEKDNAKEKTRATAARRSEAEGPNL